MIFEENNKVEMDFHIHFSSGFSLRFTNNYISGWDSYDLWLSNR